MKIIDANKFTNIFTFPYSLYLFISKLLLCAFQLLHALINSDIVNCDKILGQILNPVKVKSLLILLIYGKSVFFFAYISYNWSKLCREHAISAIALLSFYRYFTFNEQ